jgi:hypothetical protein
MVDLSSVYRAPADATVGRNRSQRRNNLAATLHGGYPFKVPWLAAEFPYCWVDGTGPSFHPLRAGWMARAAIVVCSRAVEGTLLGSGL